MAEPESQSSRHGECGQNDHLFASRALVLGTLLLFLCADCSNLVVQFGHDHPRGELADVSIRVIFSWLDGQGAELRRRFETLELERSHITFFPLTWTVVHPIDGHSPLQDWDAARLIDTHAEILVQVAGFAEVYSQGVRARTSYVAEEVHFDARFAGITEETESGGGQVDIRRIGDMDGVG